MRVSSIECFIGCDGKPLAELLKDPKLDSDPRFPRCGTNVYQDGEKPLCDPEVCEVFFITAAMIIMAQTELNIQKPTQPDEYIPFCDKIMGYFEDLDYRESVVPPCPNTGAHRWLKGSYIPHLTPSFTEKLHHGILMKKHDLRFKIKKFRWQTSEFFESLRK